MEDTTIGIKIANGDYVPIIERSRVGKKRLVLTTVNDNQDSVQVDLYQKQEENLEQAGYIGSLMLENLAAAPKGDPEIELIMGIDEHDNLVATLGDLNTGDRQSLSLGLDTLSEDGGFDMPDLDIDNSIEPASDVTEFDEESEDDYSFDTDFEEEFGDEDFDQDQYEDAGEERAEAPTERRARPGLLIIFVVLGLIIIGLLAFLIYRSFQGDSVPALFARNNGVKTEHVEKTEPKDQPEKTEAGPQADPAAKSGQEEVVSSSDVGAGEEPHGKSPPGGEKVVAAAAEENPEIKTAETAEAASPDPAVDAAVRPEVPGIDNFGGVWYWIKWGDTLWDLSYSFYRTPWLYAKIAYANNIKNPDLIFAETPVFIPEM